MRVLRLLRDTAVDTAVNTAVVFPRDRSLSLRRPLCSLVGAYLKCKVHAGPRGLIWTENARACTELVL